MRENAPDSIGILKIDLGFVTAIVLDTVRTKSARQHTISCREADVVYLQGAKRRRVLRRKLRKFGAVNEI